MGAIDISWQPGDMTRPSIDGPCDRFPHRYNRHREAIVQEVAPVRYGACDGSFHLEVNNSAAGTGNAYSRTNTATFSDSFALLYMLNLSQPENPRRCPFCRSVSCSVPQRATASR